MARSPADGIEQDYPELELPLPSLFWHDAGRDAAGIYRRKADQSGAQPGAWRYEFTGHSEHYAH